VSRPSDTRQWVAIIPFGLTVEQAEAIQRLAAVELSGIHVDRANLVGCFACECMFTSAAALRPCPGENGSAP
jgi:hypothetical protein